MSALLLCDDHRVMREALARMLSTLPGVTQVVQAGSAEEALARYPRVMPGCVLMDVRLPGMDGVNGAVEMLALYPQARVVLLSSESREEDRLRALKAGARGFLLKDIEASGLTEALGTVLAGGDLLSPSERRALAQVPRRITLSPRERQVVTGMAAGRSNGEIAVSLWLGEDAVKAHAKTLFAKIGVHDRSAAVAWAFRAGILT